VSSQPKCPKCGGADYEDRNEEVDIGVGIQTFHVGGECRVCGPMSVCYTCGAWDFEPHAKWCATADVIEEPPT
jgi:hypothetical protein